MEKTIIPETMLQVSKETQLIFLVMSFNALHDNSTLTWNRTIKKARLEKLSSKAQQLGYTINQIAIIARTIYEGNVVC